MDSFDKSWKSHFEEKVPSNSGRFKPENEVFDFVKESVFPKKKKRRVFIFWFFGVLALLIAGGVLGIFLYKSNVMDYSKNEDPIKINKTTPNEAFLELADRPTNSTLALGQTMDVKTDQKRERQSGINKSGVDKNIVMSSIPSKGANEINQNKTTSAFFKKALVEKELDFVDKNQHSQQTQHLQTSISKAGVELEALTYENDVRASQEQNKAVYHIPVQESTLLPILGLNPFILPDDTVTLEQMEPSFEVKIINKYNWSIELGALYTSWHDRLNTNYATALGPADFYSENKSGVGMYLEATRQLNKRFSLGLGGGIQSIRASSGHNSSSGYLVNDEAVPFHNIKNLTLGTPYGLVSSELTLRRSAAVTEDQEIDISVQTKHHFTSYHLYANVRFAIVKNHIWQLDLALGPELLTLSNITNQVQYQIRNSNDITVSDSDILADQQFVNSSVFALRSGLHSSINLSQNWQATLGASWTEGLTTTFDNDGLGSFARLFSFQAGVRLAIH